jgi:hypothetical protein
MPCVCKTTLIEQKKALQKIIAQMEDACETLDTLIEQTCVDHDDSEADNDDDDVLVHMHSDKLKHTDKRKAAEKKHCEQEDIKLEAMVRWETAFWTHEFDEVNKSSDVNQRYPRIDIIQAIDAVPESLLKNWKLGFYGVHAPGSRDYQLSWQLHSNTATTYDDLHKVFLAAKGIKGDATDCFLMAGSFSKIFEAEITLPKKWICMTVRFGCTNTECQALVYLRPHRPWVSAYFILNPCHPPSWYDFALPPSFL